MKDVLESDVNLANNVVLMSLACKAVGMPADVVDYGTSGAKIECPFGTLFHPDGGKSFRIYDDKTAYCYACAAQYRPVQLYAMAMDVSLDDAAETLLELSGYIKPTAESRYAAAVDNALFVDQYALEDALKTYLKRNFPSWEVAQFDDRVAHKFRQCVELLPSVKSAEDTRTWTAAAKAAMTKVLGETS